MSWSFQHKVDYEGDTKENNCDSNYSQSYYDYFVIILNKEQEYKEDYEFKEDYHTFNKINKSKMSKHKVEQAQLEQFLAEILPIKVIQFFIITVNACEHKMIEFGKENKNN